MYNTKKVKNCLSFKAVDQDYVASYKKYGNSDCENCIYCSSRNCGMEVSDSIEPTIDILN